MPKLKNSIAVQEPTIAYDNAKFSLNISGLVADDGTPDMAVNYSIIPYRVLTDGTVEEAPASNLIGGSAKSGKKADAAMAKLTASIEKALEKFLDDRGI